MAQLKKESLNSHILITIISSFIMLFSSNLKADYKDIKIVYENLDMSVHPREVVSFLNHIKRYPFEEVQSAILERLHIEIKVASAAGPNILLMRSLIEALQGVGYGNKTDELTELFLTAKNFWGKSDVWKIGMMDETYDRAMLLMEENIKPLSLLADAKEDALDFDEFLEKEMAQYSDLPEKLKLGEYEIETKEFLNKRIIGQPEVVEKVTEILLQDHSMGTRDEPELLYLMGGPGTGKDTTAEAMTDAIHKKIGAHHEHLFSVEPMISDNDISKILGSGPGYIGSEEFPPFVEFLVNHSGGRYLLEQVDNGTRVIENELWQGSDLPGFKTPSSAVVFLNEFHDWSKNSKNALVKKFLDRGTIPISNPKEGVKEIHVPVTIILASNEGLSLVSSRELNGTRYGRPLDYDESIELWKASHDDVTKLKGELSKTNGPANSNGGQNAKGNTEEMINRIPDDRLMLMRPQSPENIKLIADMRLQILRGKLLNSVGEYRNVKLMWDDSVLDLIQSYRYLAEDNARPIKSRIKTLINQTFYRALINGDIPENLNAFVKLYAEQAEDESWNLRFEIIDSKVLNKENPAKSFTIPIKETLKDIAAAPISDEQITELLEMNTRMKKKVFGADKVIDQVAESLLLSEEGRSSIKTLADAKLSARKFMFLGPSSTGKTELAKVIAEEIIGDRNDLVTIDFSQVTSIQDIKNKILGSKDANGNAIPSKFMKEYDRRNGKIVVALDEIANADKKLLNSLYDVFREPIVSTFSDNKERIMSNVTFILTGNAGEEWYAGIPNDGTTEDMQRATRAEIYKSMTKDARKTRETLKKFFSDAFINRIGEENIFFFPSLSHKATLELFNLKMQRGLQSLLPKKSQRGWQVKFANDEHYREMANILEKESFILDEQGASIDRFINQTFIDKLRYTLLLNKVPNDAEILITHDVIDMNKKEFILHAWVKGEENPIPFTIKRHKRKKMPKTKKVDQILTAYHEAGHSLVREVFLGDLNKGKRISIIPGVTLINGEWIVYAGVAEHDQIVRVPYTRELLIREIAVLAGGFMAQKLSTVGERIDAGLSNDMQRAQDLAKRAILEWGLSDEWGKVLFGPGSDFSLLTDTQKDVLAAEIQKMLTEGEDMARAALSANYDALAELSVLLAEKGDINAKVLKKFYQGHQLLDENNWDMALKQWDSQYSVQEITGVISRDAEIRAGVPLPRKVANIDKILAKRKRKQHASVTNFDAVKHHEDVVDFHPKAQESCLKMVGAFL